MSDKARVTVNETTRRITVDVSERGAAGAAGAGLPTGGTVGQVPVKQGATDYDVAWDDAAGGEWGSIGGTLAAQTDLQAALLLANGKHVRLASQNGASPSETAADNVTAIQSMLDAANAAGGGVVILDEAGDYLVNATLRIYSHTKWVQVPGAWLRKSGSNYSEVMANDGAWTGVTDEDIHFENLAINCDQNGERELTFWHSHSQFYLRNVKNVTVRGMKIIDTPIRLYCFQICTWEDVILDDLYFEGTKDGLHINAGQRMTVRNLRGDTDDDLINFNSSAGWYLTVARSGDIKNVTVEESRITSLQGGVRCSMSAWDDWTNGRTYYGSERVVNAGKIYVKVGDMATPTGDVASVAPTHTTGVVTGADDIGWRYDRDIGTSDNDYVTRTDNITFRNCYIEKGWQLDSPAGAVANRHVTPGQEGIACTRNVRYENCTFDFDRYLAASPISHLKGEGRFEHVTFDNCRFQGSNINALVTNSAVSDPWGQGYWLDLIFDNCVFDVATNWLGLVNVKHDKQKIRIAGTGNRIGPDHTHNYIHCKADAADFDLPLRVGLLNLQGGDRLRVRVASDPLEGMWNYSYGVYRREGAIHSARRLGINPFLVSSGNLAEVTESEGTVKLLTGNNDDGYAMARLARQTAVQLDQVMRFSIPWVLSGQMYVRASSDSVIRVAVGLPDDYHTGFAANADGNASAEKFIGFEIRRENTSSGSMRVRVIANDGTTYRTSAWHDLGVEPNINRLLAYQFLNRADGNVELRASATVVENGSVFPALPEAAIASIDNGPIDFDVDSGNTVWVVATTNGSTSCNYQCQAFVEPPTFELLEFA